jgi:hypothetical protein
MDRVDETPTLEAPPLSPLCREIRSKKVFTLDRIPMADEDVIDLSNHCWCRRTMQVFGPDGDIVRPQKCGPGRECYQSHFE